jgi:predicted nucleic acid-binding protein
MESVYIETSVVSYLVARPSARTVAHQWHVWTKDWWRLRRLFFECVISEEVLREAAAGDPKASRQRLDAFSTLTVLRRTQAVDDLAEAFLSAGAMPAKAKADAVHLAVATAHRVDYLLTWNLKHLANAQIWLRLRPLVEQCGYRMPMVCRPLQLMGEIEYEG